MNDKDQSLGSSIKSLLNPIIDDLRHVGSGVMVLTPERAQQLAVQLVAVRDLVTVNDEENR